LVKEKKVFINGRLAVLGSKVKETDKIEVKEVIVSLKGDII